jgi:hypothetical protein
VFRLAKPEDFFRALSRSPRSKFILAWATFAGLVIPSALLMSFGVPEKYVVPGLLVAIPLFQYAVFCIFPALNRNDGIGDKKISARAFPVPHYNVSDLVVGYTYLVEARTGVGKTSVLAHAMVQAWGTSTLSLSGTHRKSNVVFPEGWNPYIQHNYEIMRNVSFEADAGTSSTTLKMGKFSHPVQIELDA